MKKELNSRQWNIYNFLKNNCVGKENMMKASEICDALGIDRVSFKKDIKSIRDCDVITRKIGSNPQGYWMMLENEDGLDYLKQLTTTHLKTAVKQGIPKNYFHQVLNELEDDSTSDKQQRITFTPYEKKEVNKFSDDLRGEKVCKSNH